MNHQRCSRCKEEADIRHKHISGGLLYGPCLKSIAYVVKPKRQGFFSSMHYLLRRILKRIKEAFSPKKSVTVFNQRSRVKYAAQQSKATNIPRDLSQMNPQKR